MHIHVAPAQDTASDAWYTCPMHPQIREPRPGHCPICGMALEPVMPTLEGDDSTGELADLRRRFWWTVPLTITVFVLAMSGGSFARLLGDRQPWIEFLLATPVVLWAGMPFFIRAIQSVRDTSPNMWTLIGLRTGAAYAYSVLAILRPEWFPDSFRMEGRLKREKRFFDAFIGSRRRPGETFPQTPLLQSSLKVVQHKKHPDSRVRGLFFQELALPRDLHRHCRG